jgi:hypothetical protein
LLDYLERREIVDTHHLLITHTWNILQRIDSSIVDNHIKIGMCEDYIAGQVQFFSRGRIHAMPLSDKPFSDSLSDSTGSTGH